MNVFTTAYLNTRVKGHEFQRLIRELCLAASTLCVGKSVGARMRRKAFLILLATAHKGMKARIESLDDVRVLEELTKKGEEPVEKTDD